MKNNSILRLGLRRFIIVFLISLVFVGGMSELAHLFLREQTDRAPQVVELVIPAGTAEKIASGQDEPSIPDSLVFVIGDTLVVRNEDSTDHQLGPVWAPAGTSATLEMKTANAFDYTCSFKASRYLGLEVRERTTLQLRLIALGYVTPATALFIFVYSLVVFPLVPAEPKSPAAKPGEDA